MSGSSDSPGWCRRLRRGLVWLLLPLLLLAAGGYLAVAPWTVRKVWLPLAARSAGAEIQAGKIALESCFPLYLRAENFRYADPETTVEIRSARFRLQFRRLFRQTVALRDVRINGIRVVCRPAPEKNTRAVPKKTTGPVSAPADSPWYFSMRDFQIHGAVVEIVNREGKTVQIWWAQKLQGDRFQTEKSCRLTATASVEVYPDKHNPLAIRPLPFQLTAGYRLDSDFQLREFQLQLQTGIMDLSVTEEIVIRPAAGIRAAVSMQGACPDERSFQILRSETRLFRGKEEIGKLRFKGSFGDTFQCEGVVQDLDMEPYLSILAPGAKVRMKVPQAEFSASGSDFSPNAVRTDLQGRLIAQLKDLSVPVELDQQSRLFRLIMIPLEAMPTFFELLELKWSLRREIDTCMKSVRGIISGQQNLNFEQAKLDLSLQNGILKISDITLNGQDIEMESIRGRLNLVSEQLDIQTVLVVNDLKIPLNFEGSLSEPSPRFKDALKQFVLLNTPLLRKLDTLLTEPPSENDSRLEKAIKRGYRDLNRFLK